MEVMQRAVVKSRTLKPLPGEITEARIRDATLPLKVEAARRAIAACTDLPELLKLKDQAEGLAAAVRIMKTVGPEMIRNANCLLADAWRKGGELLSAYSNVKENVRGNKAGQISTVEKSPRTKIAESFGLPGAHAVAMVRLYKAPLDIVVDAVNKRRNLQNAAQLVPTVNEKFGGKPFASQAYRRIIRGPGGLGLGSALAGLRTVPLDEFAQLTPEERKIVKAKITEIVELLDEMDRLCR